VVSPLLINGFGVRGVFLFVFGLIYILLNCFFSIKKAIRFTRY
jgi:hypothetical protein